MLKRIAKCCVLKDSILQWINSYVSDCKRREVNDGQELKIADIKSGVA